MGFLSRLFGGGNTLATLRRALDEGRWAQALAIGEDIDRTALDPAELAGLEAMLAEAGDGLAAHNLAEAEACLRAGELERTSEHLDLAAGQARSPELAERIALLRKAPAEQGAAAHAAISSGSAACCPTGCGDASPSQSGPSQHADLDAQAHLELILATYPPELAERYEQAGESFRKAFLLAHTDQDQAALEVLDRISDDGRDDLFHFERGAVLGRLGRVEEALSDLETAVARNPDLGLALEALVRLEIQHGRLGRAEDRLRGCLAEGRHAAFCCARLAEISVGRGDLDEALELGARALEEGSREPEALLLTASLLENRNRLDEAEALLCRLGSGGCSGGGNIYQAEFWLRHRRNLDKALEAFKGAARQEPAEPRWPLRMAQVYLAKGWKKEGTSLLRKVLSDPRLDARLREEGQAQLGTVEAGR